MEIKINKTLLVDDDAMTTFLNTQILVASGMVGQIDVARNGEKGIEYLMEKSADGEGDNKNPELIFLDLNMPLMDGWEFMEEFAKLDPSVKSSTIIYILSASPNPDDMARAGRTPGISGFINKPLSEKLISEIIAKHFSILQ